MITSNNNNNNKMMIYGHCFFFLLKLRMLRRLSVSPSWCCDLCRRCWPGQAHKTRHELVPYRIDDVTNFSLFERRLNAASQPSNRNSRKKIKSTIKTVWHNVILMILGDRACFKPFIRKRHAIWFINFSTHAKLFAQWNHLHRTHPIKHTAVGTNFIKNSRDVAIKYVFLSAINLRA